MWIILPRFEKSHTWLQFSPGPSEYGVKCWNRLQWCESLSQNIFFCYYVPVHGLIEKCYNPNLYRNYAIES